METQKKPGRNPTPKQRRAAQAIVQNLLSKAPLPTKRVLESVSYGKLAGQPSRILESKGFKSAISETGLREALVAQGINPKKIAEKINVLLEATNGDKDDYGAIDKGLKHATAIYGVLAEKPQGTNTTYNFLFSDTVREKVRIIDADIKNLLTQHVHEDKETKENVEHDE